MREIQENEGRVRISAKQSCVSERPSRGTVLKSYWLSFDDPFLPSEKLRAHSGDGGGLALVEIR